MSCAHSTHRRRHSPFLHEPSDFNVYKRVHLMSFDVQDTFKIELNTSEMMTSCCFSRKQVPKLAGSVTGQLYKKRLKLFEFFPAILDWRDGLESSKLEFLLNWKYSCCRLPNDPRCTLRNEYQSSPWRLTRNSVRPIPVFDV